MQVWQILQEKDDSAQVITTTPEATAFEVIQAMNGHHIGSLMVVDKDHRVTGIVTERDIMRRVLKDERPDLEMAVRHFMTTDVIVGHEEDHVQYVMGIMTKNRIRHLPIVKGDKLIGVLSIGDVVSSQLEEAEHENKLLVDYITHG